MTEEKVAFVTGLLKEASRVGAYLASGALPREYLTDNPIGLGLLAGVPYAGGLAAPVSADVGGGNKAKDTDPFKKLRSETYGQTLLRRGLGGLKYGLGAGLVSALAGAGIRGYSDNPEAWAMGKGLMIGGAAMPAITGLTGGLMGAYDKYVADHTSKDSRHAARTMKAEHPLATALPFGDLVGASIYGGKKKQQRHASGDE